MLLYSGLFLAVQPCRSVSPFYVLVTSTFCAMHSHTLTCCEARVRGGGVNCILGRSGGATFRS